MPAGRTHDDPTVSGVVLAAGTSSRFGDGNKLLATVDGEPLVRRSVAPLLAADLHEIVIVVGHEGEAVREAVADLPVDIVANEDYAEGQATSVRRGLAAVDGAADAALFALGDMPDVRAETVDRLVEAFAAGAGDPLVAACDGQRGNPVLFGRRYFDRLRSVTGDTGGREIIFEAETTALIETGDPGVLRDIDRRSDLPES